MTSKNSIYKMTLEHLRHSGWMIALSFIGSMFAGPVILLFDYSSSDYLSYLKNNGIERTLLYRAQNTSSMLDSICSSMYLTVAMIGALIVALGVFYYLFQSSKIDLYHSLPLTRKELFLSGYLSGLLIWFVPFILSAVITLPLAFVAAGGVTHINMILVAFLKMLLIPFFGFIVTYHLCLVAVMLSGNMSNSIVAALVFGLTPITFYALFVTHFNQYFETFHSFMVSPLVLLGLSPIATPIAAQAYLWEDTEVGLYAFMVIAGLIIAIVNFFVARALYQKRNSELAGRGMENKSASLLIRIITGLAAGLFGVVFLYFIGISRNRVIWSMFFCIFFTVFTFTVISAVQKKTVKGLFAYKLQMIITTAVAMIFILICRFDVFGYDEYLPSKNSVKSIEVYIPAMNNYYYSNPDLYVFNNPELSYQLLETLVNPSDEDYASNITIKVNRTNGLSYYRRYTISAGDIHALKPIVETDDYFAYEYRALIENEAHIDGVSIYDITRTRTEIEDTAQAKMLYNAYMQDLKEHQTLEEMTEYICLGYLNFATKEGTSDYRVHEMPIRDTFTHTLAVMEEYYPNMLFDKNDLNIKCFSFSVGLEDDTTIEEDFMNRLMPVEETEDEMLSITINTENFVSVTEYREYLYSASAEEISWLLPYLKPCRDYFDGLNQNSYVYLGELELNTGSSLSTYVEIGSMKVEDIRKLAKIVEENATLYGE